MASREAGRIDLALTRGIYLVVSLAICLPALQIELSAQKTGMAPGATGWITTWAVWIPSLILLFVLAGRLGGDAVGDFGSGLLDLIFVTGLRPWQWLVVRVIQMWVGFLSVWVVRLPILVCLFALGRVGIGRIVVAETLLLTAFLFLSGIALLGSFKTKSRQQVWSRVMLPVTIWELLLRTPVSITGMIATYYGWTIPTPISDSLDTMAETAISSQMWTAVSSATPLADSLPTIVLYLVVSALVLLRFLCRLRAASQGLVGMQAVDQSQAAEFQSAPQRTSRRCWDDALAWQAFCIHGYGKGLIQLKCVAYTLLAIGLVGTVALSKDDVAVVFGVVAAICLIVLLISVGKPSDCLSREIRDETMPTLLLTPNSTDDFYKGWQRGAWHLAWPDILLAILLMLVGFSLHGYVPWIALSLTLAILFAGPFMMLSPLVPVTWKGVATGLGLTFVFLVIAVVCIGLGAATHPVFVPLALIPLAYLFNSLVRRFVLPYWMERKISSIV